MEVLAELLSSEQMSSVSGTEVDESRICKLQNPNIKLTAEIVAVLCGLPNENSYSVKQWHYDEDAPTPRETKKYSQ